MESPDLNPASPSEAELEARLRALAGPALPDDGFSARVLAALPKRRAALPLHTWLIPALGALAGLFLALRQGASVAGAADSLEGFLSGTTTLDAVMLIAFLGLLAFLQEDLPGQTTEA